MEHITIEYKGEEYRAVRINIPEVGETYIADGALWSAIQWDYGKGVKAAEKIDDSIYFYVKGEMLSDETSEEELFEYIKEYLP